MASVVRKIDVARGSRLRDRLEQDGYSFRTDPHAHWFASGPGVTVIHYRSGKLLVQGKHAEDFLATHFDELGLLDGPPAGSQDEVTEPIIGSDESGKGDYFGPLVIAAMLVRPEDAPVLRTLGARDSKEVGDAEALEIARQIADAWPDAHAVVSIGPAKYNELHAKFGGNLNRLLAWGHATAVGDVLAKIPCGRVISDQFGDERLVRDALVRKGIDVRLEQRPRAESHPAVAAASILARARFLRDLRRLGDEFGHKLPKGAGTPVDVAARAIFRERGMEGLAQVAKVHFRTTLKAKGHA
jgi:ribonuclease HIII